MEWVCIAVVAMVLIFAWVVIDRVLPVQMVEDDGHEEEEE